MTLAFDLSTEVHEQQNGDYLGVAHDGWDIRGNANGDYVLALVAPRRHWFCARVNELFEHQSKFVHVSLLNAVLGSDLGSSIFFAGARIQFVP